MEWCCAVNQAFMQKNAQVLTSVVNTFVGECELKQSLLVLTVWSNGVELYSFRLLKSDTTIATTIDKGMCE